MDILNIIGVCWLINKVMPNFNIEFYPKNTNNKRLEEKRKEQIKMLEENKSIFGLGSMYQNTPSNELDQRLAMQMDEETRRKWIYETLTGKQAEVTND